LDAIPLLGPTLYEMEDKSTIFNAAHSTLSWKGTKDSKAVRDALSVGLSGILIKPYWTRVWIIQELIAARALFLMDGLSVVDYAGLQMILIVMEMYRSRSVQNEGSSAASIAADGLSGGSSVVASHLTTTEEERIALVDSFRSPKPVDAPVDRSWMKRLAWHLSFYAFMHQSTDPRDKVFGLSGISEVGPTPDYAMPAENVYVDYATIYVKEQEDLQLLSMSGIGFQTERTHKLPSWVPEWDNVDWNQMFLYRRLPGVTWEAKLAPELPKFLSTDAKEFEVDQFARLSIVGCVGNRVSSIDLRDGVEVLADCSARDRHLRYITGISNREVFLRTVCFNSYLRDLINARLKRDYSVPR
jgi:hypothetical protein